MALRQKKGISHELMYANPKCVWLVFFKILQNEKKIFLGFLLTTFFTLHNVLHYNPFTLHKFEYNCALYLMGQNRFHETFLLTSSIIFLKSFM